MHLFGADGVAAARREDRVPAPGGAAQGVVGIVDLGLGREIEDKTEFRSTLTAMFSVLTLVLVIDYIVVRGRGVLNTAIYCTLTVCLALLVNPLAAYALSRYKPPSAYKILLFLGHSEHHSGIFPVRREDARKGFLPI